MDENSLMDGPIENILNSYRAWKLQQQRSLYFRGQDI